MIVILFVVAVGETGTRAAGGKRKKKAALRFKKGKQQAAVAAVRGLRGALFSAPFVSFIS